MCIRDSKYSLRTNRDAKDKVIQRLKREVDTVHDMLEACQKDKMRVADRMLQVQNEKAEIEIEYQFMLDKVRRFYLFFKPIEKASMIDWLTIKLATGQEIYIRHEKRNSKKKSLALANAYNFF